VDRKYEQGFTTLLILLLIVLVASVSFFLIKVIGKNDVKIDPKSVFVQRGTVSTDKPAFIPTPSPTPPPIPSLTPVATPPITKSPSPKPATPKPVSGPPGAGFSRITVATEKGNFPASVLNIDLNSARMVTDTGNDNDCGTGCNVFTLQDYVNRNAGFAGVNGTYFCPATYGECSAKTDSYDFPVYNTRLSHWINGGNLFWNSRAIFYFDGSGAHYNQNAKDFGGGLLAGVVNFPGLLDNGNVQIDDGQSGLSDKQKVVGTKVGIGLIDSKHVLVVVASGVNMQQFAYVFKSLGARGALNLDTGGSTALYYGGKYIYGPGRKLPNAIIFAK
jgi:hypothetical protein